MSRYQGFYDEQPFQKATFSIDSPERRRHESNRVELPKEGKQSLHAYFKDDNLYGHSPTRVSGIKHLEGDHIEKAMHHLETRLSEFNGNKMPANWELAEKHAMSRTVRPEIPDPHAEVCVCCGYQIEREELPLCADNDELRFLGSGFPLFYNFLKYCMLIMVVLLMSNGGYNLYTNYKGTFCTEEGDEEGGCQLNWMSQLSLPNKMDNDSEMEIQENLNLLSCFLIIIVLMLFRRSQRKINAEIDEKQNSPADYTIIVRGIPTNRDSDYIEALKTFFTHMIDPHKKYNVTKVNLLYEIDEVEVVEKKINANIEQKKLLLERNKFNYQTEEIKEIDEKNEKLEEELDKLLKNIEKNPDYFAGMAFVSFETEDEKMEVIRKAHASKSKRFKDFLKGSRLHRQHGYYKEKDEFGNEILVGGEGLFFHGFRLQIDEAPEPNDINWESINSTNYDKIVVRTKSGFSTFLLLALGFGVIFLIKYYQSQYLEEAVEELGEEEEEVVAEAENTIEIVEYLNYVIAILIIFFNKIFVGPLVDKIVESEKITTETRVNISFAQKLTLSLFFNTALITLIIEVLISKNYYQTGGLIFSELLICIVDVGVELIIWLIDPYAIIKRYKLSAQKSKGNQCTLTQNEANSISEYPSYSMSDRYSDIIKTMWFVFMYATLIPLVTVLFLVGMFLFYWIDKYNLYRRRAIKESINIELSTEMIEMLELIIPIYGISNFIYDYDLFNTTSWQSLVILGVGILFAIIPMESVNEWLFQIESQNEVLKYHDVVAQFDTDYDRENPVTKKKALLEWRKLREMEKLERMGEYV